MWEYDMEIKEKMAAGKKAGAYLRLSREDGDKQESDSIRGQRQLIRDFEKNHPDIRIVKEYTDDGYSGTNFDRPNFKEMLRDAESGLIDCIVVKDLSRLGRNYIGTGKYTERVFPSMGIRFISINDNYDSAVSDCASNNVILPFKNLINDAYSRDISIKIRSQLDVKRRQGRFIGSFAAYGYRKAENDNNRLVVDAYAAGIVQNIFKWKLDGWSCHAIAEKLNENGVLSPFEYKRAIGMNYNCGFKAKTKAEWTQVQVRRILTNEVYIGNMVQGKYRKLNYKLKQIRAVPENEWIRAENTHQPIIEAESFERVRELLLLDTRAAGNKGSNIFSGLVRCADCGQCMVRRVGGTKKNKRFYLHCSTYKAGMGCTSHLVSEDKLMAAVKTAIHVQAVKIMQLEEVARGIRESPNVNWRKAGAAGHMKVLEAEIERYRILRMQLYEDRNAGIISEEDYVQFSSSFTQKLEDALVAKRQAEEEMEALTRDGNDEMVFISLFKKYAGAADIDRRMLVEMVDHIDVADKEHFTIHFRYEDKIAALIRLCADCREEDENSNTETAGGVPICGK